MPLHQGPPSTPSSGRALKQSAISLPQPHKRALIAPASWGSLCELTPPSPLRSRSLQAHFGDEPFYGQLVDLFHEVTWQTSSGQLLDLITEAEQRNSGGGDLERYTYDVHRHIVVWKTAFYSFYLPVACAMVLAGVKDKAAYARAQAICMKMGEYFQVQVRRTSGRPNESKCRRFRPPRPAVMRNLPCTAGGSCSPSKRPAGGTRAARACAVVCGRLCSPMMCLFYSELVFLGRA